jgi:hypothetical protein
VEFPAGMEEMESPVLYRSNHRLRVLNDIGTSLTETYFVKLFDAYGEPTFDEESVNWAGFHFANITTFYYSLIKVVLASFRGALLDGELFQLQQMVVTEEVIHQVRLYQERLNKDNFDAIVRDLALGVVFHVQLAFESKLKAIAQSYIFTSGEVNRERRREFESYYMWMLSGFQGASPDLCYFSAVEVQRAESFRSAVRAIFEHGKIQPAIYSRPFSMVDLYLWLTRAPIFYPQEGLKTGPSRDGSSSIPISPVTTTSRWIDDVQPDIGHLLFDEVPFLNLARPTSETRFEWIVAVVPSLGNGQVTSFGIRVADLNESDDFRQVLKKMLATNCHIHSLNKEQSVDPIRKLFDLLNPCYGTDALYLFNADRDGYTISVETCHWVHMFNHNGLNACFVDGAYFRCPSGHTDTDIAVKRSGASRGLWCKNRECARTICRHPCVCRCRCYCNCKLKRSWAPDAQYSVCRFCREGPCNKSPCVMGCPRGNCIRFVAQFPNHQCTETCNIEIVRKEFDYYQTVALNTLLAALSFLV